MSNNGTLGYPLSRKFTTYNPIYTNFSSTKVLPNSDMGKFVKIGISNGYAVNLPNGSLVKPLVNKIMLYNSTSTFVTINDNSGTYLTTMMGYDQVEFTYVNGSWTSRFVLPSKKLDITTNGTANTLISSIVYNRVDVISSSLAIITYLTTVSGVGYYLYAAMEVISGTTISITSTTQVAFNSSVSFDCVGISVIDSTKALVTYKGNGGMKARVLSLSGATITSINTEYTLNSTEYHSSTCDVCVLSPTSALSLVYAGINGSSTSFYMSLMALSISGTTVTSGSYSQSLQISSSNNNLGSNSCCIKASKLNSTSAIYIFFYGNTGAFYLGVTSVSGTTITGMSSPIYGGSTGGISFIIGITALSPTRAIYVWSTTSNSYCQLVSISGTSITTIGAAVALTTTNLVNYAARITRLDNYTAMVIHQENNTNIVQIITIYGDIISVSPAKNSYISNYSATSYGYDIVSLDSSSAISNITDNIPAIKGCVYRVSA